MSPATISCPLDFESIYRKYHKRVYNYIYGQILQREAAEDLAADVFVAVATNLGRFDPTRGSFSIWLFTIARNLTQNYRLRASNRLEETREELPERFADPPKEQDESLHIPENARTERILTQLSNEERSFLEYRYVLDLSNEEIGRLIGTSAATVSQRYHRLLAKCRKIDRNE